MPEIETEAEKTRAEIAMYLRDLADPPQGRLRQVAVMLLQGLEDRNRRLRPAPEPGDNFVHELEIRFTHVVRLRFQGWSMPH